MQKPAKRPDNPLRVLKGARKAEGVHAAALAINGAHPARLARQADAGCGFMDRLHANAAKLSGDDLRRAIADDPEFSPRFGLDAFAAARDVYPEDEADACQLFWAREMLGWDFAYWSHKVARVLKDQGGEICAGAWILVMQWWGANDHRAKAFFSRPEVLALIPDTDETAAALTALPHGGWRGLDKPVRGARRRAG